MLNIPLLLAFTCLLFGTGTLAAQNDNGVTFLYPPAGLTFNYLDTVNLSYTSPYRKPVLLTLCLKYSGGQPLEKDNQYGRPYDSSALVLIRWTEFVSCYFVLRPSKAGQNSSLDTKSPWFRIDPEARPTPITFGLEQNATTIPTDTPDSSGLPAQTLPPAGGLSSGAKIGIGVGVALGVLLVLAGAIVIFLRRRKKTREIQANAQLLDSGTEGTRSDSGAGQDGNFMPMRPIPLEMQAKETFSDTPHELPSEINFEMQGGRRMAELSVDQGV